MAYLRACGLVLFLLGFFLFGVPTQMVLRRFGTARMQTWLVILFHRGLCRLLRLRVRAVGSPASVPTLMLAPNHVSWTDISVLGGLYPLSFLAKSEVGTWPIIGPMARLCGTIFVVRGRRTAIPAVNAQLAAHMRRGDRVVLFAEGTTGDGNRLMKFHSSHFEAAKIALRDGDVWVQPVSIAYMRRDGLPLGRIGRMQVAWYGDMTLAPHLWDLLRDGPVDCVVSFDEPVQVTQAMTRKDLCAAVRMTTRTRLGELVHGHAADVKPVGTNVGLIASPAE
ncbi:lysophospholipid acyltransferase family protein [Methylovirgula sp. 4M-Z18]|uniref:lysophospholipid acyltransferase family protein n=1 Tax=Methylovirgula sp. 4M-Z18 TaxID=2293567 RepID=UPI00131502AB|nr:lysophospholipid acyltransferase family protein [Methylovirgula sp. 4M-Z18]